MKNIKQSTDLEYTSIEVNTKLLKAVQDFQTIFDSYFNALMEYLNAGIVKNANPNTIHEYELGHPTLFNLANQLQFAYLQLPKNLQNRLLDLEFDVFLHCNNIVDFYSFRSFLLKKQRFNKTSTIAVRVDAEIQLAEMLIKNDSWSKLSRLPKRNFNFYQEEENHPKLMEELKLDLKIPETNNIQNEREEVKISEGNENVIIASPSIKNNIFNTITEKLKFGETILGLGNSYVEKATSIWKHIVG
ncbi:hypothetical protein CON43_01120 [Bacillus cereus]|uniref:hypothetical protein n=1 Tax=Bacillus cereus TaxID=1396 RepID=UPI000BED7967|nr:hypothetical protein [Bacillus cereus]PED91581.1 hypothetical protein CON43_01120 [Bacillus cereus]